MAQSSSHFLPLSDSGVLSLPQKVTCTVVETEPVVKGQTAANSFKPAVLDNGVKVMVPPFVGQDEEIVVNTETMEYSERA